MPSYVDRTSGRVLVLPLGTPPPAGAKVIDGETAASVGVLTDGMPITDTQADMLLEGNVSGFIRTLGDGYAPPAPPTADQRLIGALSGYLPPVGRWEYKVVRVSEMGGFGTAKGTAERMAAVLNDEAKDGWELITTSERDSRFIGGETIMLTMRRFLTSHGMFANRIREEEMIRRRVMAEFD